MWRVLDTGKGSATSNMDLAGQLLRSLPHLRDVILHQFEWARPTVTYGVLVRPRELLDLDQVAARGLDSAQRPTGGGVMFHVEDLSFSLVVPASFPGFSLSPDRNYAWVNQAVSRAIENCMGSGHSSLLADSLPAPNPRAARFCMSTPTRYDILWNGKKVGGAAQRCTRAGFLHQGSIALVHTPEEWLSSCIRNLDLVQTGLQNHAGALLESPASALLSQDLRKSLRFALQEAFAEAIEEIRHADRNQAPVTPSCQSGNKRDGSDHSPVG